jgi:lipoyl(octanoyl) transferase
VAPRERSDQRRESHRPLVVRDLGLIDYADAVRVQDQLVDARLRGAVPDTLLLLEHPPVITLGRRASLSDIYGSPDELSARGIEVHRTTRGGLVTYHGPGQLVGYPIVHLRERGLSVPEYVYALERATIDALAEIGVSAWTDPAHVGVWTAGGKIAAIGVAVRHRVTLHGFAVNLDPDLSHFALINPCGIGDRGVTSTTALLEQPTAVGDFKTRIARTLTGALASSSPARKRSAAVPVSS